MNNQEKRKWSHCLLPATKRDIAELKKIMSDVSNELTLLKTQLTTVQSGVAAIGTGIVSLFALIKTLQGSSGTLSPDDQKTLDDAEAIATSLVTQVQSISTTPPAA
jgi:hypothetical protein